LNEDRQNLEAMADEIFELSNLISTARSRQPGKPSDLSESEFLTLDLLGRGEPLTIGEIQRQIGVVPAQMSRIVRALEDRKGGGYIRCTINPRDRRRVDVGLTGEGRKAHDIYRKSRLSMMLAIVSALTPVDREAFMRILRQIRATVTSRLDAQEPEPATGPPEPEGRKRPRRSATPRR
jgi:DNA-binding MarR family transcriptional regulator